VERADGSFGKYVRIDAIHRCVVLDVREEHRALHRTLERAPGGGEHLLDVLERLAGLTGNARIGELARAAHVADLTRQIQDVSHPHSRGERQPPDLAGAVQHLAVLSSKQAGHENKE